MTIEGNPVFKCEKCGYEDELVFGIFAGPCPKCGAKMLFTGKVKK